ncbi:transposase [Geobacillus stearothermophilus]|nr:transposase [Geobacillus stearothermophilus]MED3755487.1 transposase [Geobacillus stearothermophilus]
MYMKRRKHSKEFKLQVVKEALEVGNKALVARRYELSLSRPIIFSPKSPV